MHLLTAPESLAAAATDLSRIGATMEAACSAATAGTSGLAAAAGDEVSAAIADLFSAYGDQYRLAAQQAAEFHSGFTAALAEAASTYVQAESCNATLLIDAAQSVLGFRPPAAPTGTSGGVGGALSIAPSALLANPMTALIMSGTSNPTPSLKYINEINTKYIQPSFAGAVPQGLTTPEQLWPLTPRIGDLTFNQSVAKGVTILDNTIAAELLGGNDVVAFGFSQSASIVHNEIVNLMAAGAPHPNDLAFMMIGSPNNPGGGILARFPGFYIPIMDVSFTGATPANTPYATTIYTAQYDGVAHVPQYPLNVLADINAMMGYFYVHNVYPTVTPAELANAVPLPTSPGYTGHTQYYMLLTQDLPLVQPIRDIPYVGQPLANLIQPPLRVLVDLGYADYGVGANYADIPTPAGLLSIPNPFTVSYYLLKGAVQGPYGAVVSIGEEAGLWGPQYYPDSYPWVPSVNPGLNVFIGQPQVTALSVLSGALGDVLHIIPPIFN